MFCDCIPRHNSAEIKTSNLISRSSRHPIGPANKPRVMRVNSSRYPPSSIGLSPPNVALQRLLNDARAYPDSQEQCPQSSIPPVHSPRDVNVLRSYSQLPPPITTWRIASLPFPATSPDAQQHAAIAVEPGERREVAKCDPESSSTPWITVGGI